MKSIWINIILFIWIEPAIAQFPDLRFAHLNDRDGLSNNQVHDIVQDDRGIIWISTENGLDRYDGYGFKTFYVHGDANLTMQNNQVGMLVPDDKGNLWGSAPEGVFCLNTVSQHMHFFSSDPRDTNSFRDPLRPFLYLDRDQRPWVFTRDGLYHFRDSLHYDREANDIGPDTGKAIVGRSVYGPVVRDRQGRLWSSRDNTIYRLDANTKKIVQAFTYPYPGDLLIRELAFDRYDRCWISSWGKGIVLLDTRNGGWQSFHPSKDRPVIRGGVEWVVNGIPYMVFACSTPALLLVDERDLSIQMYPFDGTTMMMSSPPYVDRQNILWITSSDGVYYTTSSDNLFGVIDLPPINKDFEQPNKLSYVYNMKEVSSGYWISKRDFGGIFWYDKQWKLLQYWRGIPMGPGIHSPLRDTTTGEAFDFMQVGDRVYMTTEGGISVLDLQHRQWSVFRPPGLLSAPRLRTIVVENDSTWWVRSFSQGVFVFNPRSDQFTKHYSNGCANCLGSEENYLLQDSRHRVWVTTNTGLFRYDKETDRFEKVGATGGPMRVQLYGMAEDRDGLIWIGAENGLFAYDPARDSIRRVITEGSRIGRAYRVCVDRNQNVWFIGRSGYWCWLREQDRVIHFDYSLGLPRTDEGIIYSTSDGSVYGGGKDAAVRFWPDRIQHYRAGTATRLIEAVIHDTVAAWAVDAEGRKTLTVSPEDNSIQVNFDVINYDLPGTNQYYYRLSPGDKGWSRSEDGHLSFNSLQPGKYALEVKGGSSLTDAFTNTDTLTIVVRPYWYQSGWFKLWLLLLATLAVLMVVRLRIGQIRKEGRLGQKITEMEMTALRAQMNPHFIFNSLNSIETFIMQNEKRLASDYLNKFASLMRMILENSRKQSVSLSRDMEAIRLYVDLEKLRFEDKFCYITEIDPPLLVGDYKVAPLLIQPFVENAIIHGIAPSEREGLYLKITVRLDGDYIHYRIEDNGIGRAASLAYTRQRRTVEHKSLGLAISRERIEILNRLKGSDAVLEIVDLEDTDGQAGGTRVLLTLKIA